MLASKQVVLFGGYSDYRQRVISQLQDIIGSTNIRICYIPNEGEGLAVNDGVVSGQVWTHANSPTNRIAKQGNGFGLTLNGTSDYLSTPDANALSFGNSVLDSPFSIVVMANVTNTANAALLLSKWNAANVEWELQIFTDDNMYLSLGDNSVPALPNRATNTASTQSVPVVYGTTYDGTGGALAMNGALIYENGALKASTATNSGTYVAMENLASRVEIGSASNGTGPFLPGIVYAAVLAAGVLSATQMASINNVLRTYLRL